jgi:hypothetical protein
MAINSPTPQAETPTPTPRANPEIRDEAPIVSFLKWVRTGIDKAGTGLVSGGNATEEYLQDNLRFDTEGIEPDETTLLKTTVHATGHIIDGTIGNIARRSKEIITPAFEEIAAKTRLLVNNVLHPIEAMKNFKERVFKPAVRTISAPLQMASEIINAPTKMIHDATERAIHNPITQTNHKINKVPVLGEAWSYITNGATKIATKVSGFFKRGVQWLTSPIRKLHEAAAPVPA